ncbi:GntR family transcriptional regulator [Alicyclobacillus contaminans]|uniref:GntR family transcriptional regulator n=1 Tax=Alicyclobacillus contaminans TaxID=392016 RepID=UPI0003FFA6D6|nr:GntR family transcriptional regulator [Alicyclobacillus contaminans]GMA51983.1 GntR family transcriptional regulator [Alicyclobacillus contaminans]
MWLHVDPRSAVPVYQQVVEGVKAAVARGVLKPGDKLPSVRELAMELTINHNTVAKAYQELERLHVIEVIRGRGTFIAAEPVPADRDHRMRELKHAMVRWIVEAHHMQMDEEALLELFRTVLQEWRNGREHE